MSKETGGPAFGSVISLDCVRVNMDGSEEYEPKVESGNLTVRDYFAAKAISKLITLCANDDRSDGESFVEHVARHAYLLADAMLKERGK